MALMSLSVNLAAAPYTFPFKFDSSGWHQFVINTTWGRPTIVSAYSARLPDMNIA